MKYILIIIVVGMICAGQLLFKVIAKNMPSSFAVMDWITFVFAPLTLSVFFLYGIATFLWIYVLKLYPLSEVYPMTALSFLIVPICSYFIFDEHLSMNLLIGSIFIIVGIIIAMR